MKLPKLTYLLLVLLAVSCKKDETPGPQPAPAGSYQVNFSAVAGPDQPYVMNQEYTLPDGAKYKLGMATFYASNIRLVKTDGSEAILKDVVFVDLGPAKAGVDTTSVGRNFKFSAPVGTYKSLKIDLGVQPGMEGIGNKEANQYPDNSALADDRDCWWGWDNTYRYISFMGKASKDTNTVSLRYHVRTQSFRRTMEFPLGNLEIKANETQKAELKLHIDKMFINPDGVTMDIMKDYATDADEKSPEQLRIAKNVMDNMAKAFTKE